MNAPRKLKKRAGIGSAPSQATAETYYDPRMRQAEIGGITCGSATGRSDMQKPRTLPGLYLSPVPIDQVGERCIIIRLSFFAPRRRELQRFYLGRL